jgi:hypothetical protein
MRAAGDTKITDGVVYLERTQFRRWLAEQGESPHEFVKLIKAEGADATPQSGKASLGKHTDIRLPQSYVVGIHLQHPRLVGILDDVAANYERTKVVSLTEALGSAT